MSTGQPRYFVIFGAMRTGSNLLEETLGAIRGVRIFGEPFNPGFTGHPGDPDVAGWAIDRRDRDPLGCLERILHTAGDDLAGFRMFEGHAPAVQARALSDPRCASIVLRRDPIESYVSLKIALLTDQWLVRNPANRLRARVRFDGQEFETYLAGLEAYYRGISEQIEAAGINAFELDYRDLTDPDALARLASFLGLDPDDLPARPPLTRQNPEPMYRKVANYAEMAGMATKLGLGELPEIPVYEWQAPAVISPSCPGFLAVLTGGPGEIAALGILASAEGQKSGRAPATYYDLPSRRTLGGTYETLATMNAIARGLEGAVSFAFVAHPVVRAHFGFLTLALDRSRGDRAIRRTLEARCGPVPRRRDVPRLLKTEDGIATCRELFDAYLDLVENALDGQGPHQTEPVWLSQAEALDHWQARFRLDHVFRVEEIRTALKALGKGRKSLLTPAAVRDLERLAQSFRAHIGKMITPETEGRIHTIWGRDFDTFDYGALE